VLLGVGSIKYGKKELTAPQILFTKSKDLRLSLSENALLVLYRKTAP
jgi:hypothetical protein